MDIIYLVNDGSVVFVEGDVEPTVNPGPVWFSDLEVVVSGARRRGGSSRGDASQALAASYPSSNESQSSIN